MSTLTQCLQTQAHENSDNHTHARTHVTVLCTLAPLHRSHFTATPEIKFLWQRRAAEEEAREEEKDGRETERARWRLLIGWSWLNLALNFIRKAEHRSRKLSDSSLKERTEECSRAILLSHLSFILISLSTPSRAFLKNSF